MEQPSVLNFDDSVLAFSEQARAELARQQDLLDLVKDERKKQWRGTIVPLLLLVLTGVFIFLYPKALWSWFIASLVLYSWNFIFLILPTTRKGVQNNGNVVKQKKSKEQRRLAYRRLLGKPKLTIEIVITLFLGRLVPLTIGFTLILGVGLVVLVGFVLTDYKAVSGLANLIIIQVVLIFIFYTLVNFLEPQSQGVSEIARSWKKRMGAAKLKGRTASFIVKSAAVAVLVTVAVIFIGALVIPGYTFLTLLTSLRDYGIWDVLLFFGIFAEQFWIMRSFQSVMSSRMAHQKLNSRIDKLEELVERANNISTMTKEDLARCDALLAVTREFYSLMLYDIYRVDLFGRSPVYLVGPCKKYVFDEKVLCHVP
ncbi:MAG: hypothetical protein AB9860_05355 [Methanomassiliicoccales archaeon]